MSAETYLSVAGIFLIIPLVLLLPLWYAAYTYPSRNTEPLSRWKFAFISLFLSYGVSTFAGVLLFPIQAAALKLGHQLEIDGWHRAADFLGAFRNFSQPLWLIILLTISLLMPSRIEAFVGNVRNHGIGNQND